MKRKISKLDVEDQETLRLRLQEAYDHLYTMLEEVEELKRQVGKSGGGGGLSARDRTLLETLAVGSTENPVTPQRSVIPTVDALPPVTTAQDGEVVRLATDGKSYIFDAETLTWEEWNAATPADMVTLSTPQTITGAKTVSSLLTLSRADQALLLTGNAAANTKMIEMLIAAVSVFSVDREGDLVANSASFASAVATISSAGIFSSTAQCSAYAYANATQSLTSGALTAISLAAEAHDQGGMHDNVTNNSRLTIPAGGGGTYLMYGQIAFAASGVGTRQAQILGNGSVLLAKSHLVPGAAGNISIAQAFAVRQASVGDYIEVHGRQDSGGALNTDATDGATTFLLAHKLC